MSVAAVLCPVHHKLLIAHRDEYPACLQCEINRLREWLEGIRAYADRVAHGAASGSGVGLLRVSVGARQALEGVAENYQYRDRPSVTMTIADSDALDFGAEYEDLKS